MHFSIHFLNVILITMQIAEYFWPVDHHLWKLVKILAYLYGTSLTSLLRQSKKIKWVCIFVYMLFHRPESQWNNQMLRSHLYPTWDKFASSLTCIILRMQFQYLLCWVYVRIKLSEIIYCVSQTYLMLRVGVLVRNYSGALEYWNQISK